MKIAHELWNITFGIENGKHGFLWPYLYHTVYASVIGLAVGVLSGYFVGVLLSEVKFLDQSFRPFIIFLNNVPRILIIPLIIIIFGFGPTSEVVSASIIVFYVTFFNAYEGGRQVDPAIVSFVRVLGGKRRDVLTKVRFYNALVWTAAQLPNATAFGVLGTITAEVLGTGNGIGYLIVIDLSEFNTTQLFALLVVTAFFGFGLIQVTRVIVRSSLRWNRAMSA